MSNLEGKKVSEDGENLYRRPSKRTTIDLEEGGIARPGSDTVIGRGSGSGTTGGEATTSTEEKSAEGASSSREKTTMSLGRNESEQGLGLGGPDMGPPRRSTMNSIGQRALGRSFTSLFVPDRRLKPSPSVKQSLLNIVKYNYLNVLVLLIPVSWALHFATPDNDLAIFLTSFLAIMPLAALLSYGTEEISFRVGQTLGGLLNATLGNAVELIVAIIALLQCQLIITQTSLVGSVLSNLLLVLGMCFFIGGLRYKEQEFKQTAAQLNTSMLFMAVISALIPAGFHASLGAVVADNTERSELLKLSRGASIILVVMYVGYLYFQLRSHTHLYADDEAEEEPTLQIWVAGGLLVVSTILVGVTSEWLVDSLDGFSSQYGVPKSFIGLILLPIVSNAAEHVTAVVAARRNAVDLAMGVAVGSSIQIAIFVLPLLVIIGWIADKPLSLLFDPFVAILLFLAVLIVSYAIADGRSNWMEGWILQNVFVLMAFASWYIPDYTGLFPDEYCKDRNYFLTNNVTSLGS